MATNNQPKSRRIFKRVIICFLGILLAACAALGFMIKRDYDRIHADLPEEASFYSWVEKFGSDAVITKVDPTKKRRPIVSVDFLSEFDGTKEPLTISDEEIGTYLVKLPAKKVGFYNYKISAGGAIALMTNPNLEEIRYYRSFDDKTVGRIVYLKSPQERAAVQELLSSLMEDPEEDFLNVLTKKDSYKIERSKPAKETTADSDRTEEESTQDAEDGASSDVSAGPA